MPLAMFLAFNAALLAVPGPPGDPLARLVVQGGPVLSAGVTVFSLLAIFTSFAGTSIGSLAGPTFLPVVAEGVQPAQGVTRGGRPGLSATLASELQAAGAAAGRDLAPAPDRVLQRAAVLAVALAPPLAISLAHPGSFLTVLQVRRLCKAGVLGAEALHVGCQGCVHVALENGQRSGLLGNASVAHEV